MIRTRLAKKNLARIALASLAILAVGVQPLVAAADEKESDEGRAGMLYLDYLVGVTHSPDGTIRGEQGASVGLFGKVRPAPAGYFVGGSLGGYVTDDIRAEVQVGFRLTEIDRIKAQGENSNAAGSDLSLFTVMYNAYYDFDVDAPVTPWLGVGIGWGMPQVDAQNTAGPMQLAINDKDSTFVYNVMGGLTYPIADAVDLVVGYRYLRSLEFDVEGRASGTRERFEYEYEAHEGYTGVRFSF